MKNLTCRAHECGFRILEMSASVATMTMARVSAKSDGCERSGPIHTARAKSMIRYSKVWNAEQSSYCKPMVTSG